MTRKDIDLMTYLQGTRKCRACAQLCPFPRATGSALLCDHRGAANPYRFLISSIFERDRADQNPPGLCSL